MSVTANELAKQTSVWTGVIDVCSLFPPLYHASFDSTSVFSLLDFFFSAFADASIRESLRRSPPPRDLENDVSGSPKPADEIEMIDGVSFVRVIRLHYTSSCAFCLYMCLYMRVGVATCRVAFPLPFAYSATPPPVLNLS